MSDEDALLRAQQEAAVYAAQASAELAAIKNELADLRDRFGHLGLRQLFEVDQEIMTIRHRMGWLFVPKEDFASIAHLSDGVSYHEAGTLAVLEKLVRPGHRVIDAGAHIGLVSLPLARHVGPEGELISVEPSPRSIETLRRTLMCNGLLDRVALANCAVSDEEGVVDFFLGANSMLNSLFPLGDQVEATRVNVRTLDGLVDGVVNLVKIDVEGAELKVLAGMRQIIARSPQIRVIAELGPGHLERVGIEIDHWFACFEAAGLTERYLLDESAGCLRPFAIDDVRDIFSANILFAKAGDPLEGLIDLGGSSAATENGQ